MTHSSHVSSFITAGTPRAMALRRHVPSVAHDRPRTHRGTAVNDGLVQDDRPTADERAVLDHAALEVREVSDHAVVADDRGVLVDGVDDGAVLDRGALAHDDRAVVAAQHRARPDRRVGADVHVADDDGVGVDEGVGVDRRDVDRPGRRWARDSPSGLSTKLSDRSASRRR